MTLEQALVGTKAPISIIDQLVIIDIPYISFSGLKTTGQLVVHEDLASELQVIFEKVANLAFPIEKMIPIVQYEWDDIKSVTDNNSSGFNYRLISGTNRPSLHALGRAVDINPRINPYFGRLGVEPAEASYDPNAKGVLFEGSSVVNIFLQSDWTWLGRRAEYPDYQHFEKPAQSI